ncbi:Crp/Fnr family transcriptional regulator [Actinomyces culturomici]|uniref:Crp/Fnr family transcriptional regulator n=1 Tax=Actinomyces culturomici TaxID=1926276 RepID=UPI0013583728|nr:Crp/Fnr family transcriptional regulator [Actinomyces culturomici]
MSAHEHRRHSPVDSGCEHSHGCSTATKRAVLARSRWFKGLDDHVLDDLVECVVEHSWNAGENLYHQGDPASSVWVIAAGVVALTTLGADGEESMTDLRSPGDMLGALSADPAAAHEQGARALTTTCAIAIDDALLRRLVSAHPGVGLSLLEDVGSQLIEARGRGALHARRSVPQRLASLLLGLAERIGEEQEDGSLLLQVPLGRADLAKLASTSTESVSRTMSAWRKSGIVEAGRRWIAVRDPEALADLVEGA